MRWTPPYRRVRRRYRRIAWERDRGVCAQCGHQDPNPSIFGPWHADHIVPCADGGAPLDPANIQTLCVPCHEAKTGEEATDRAGQELVRFLDWLGWWTPSR